MPPHTPSRLLARRALAAALGLAAGSALAQPAGLSALHGSASVAVSGSTTTVTTVNGAGSRHSALDWRSFGVGSGQTVHFAQPDALSLSINRVTGNDPSRIAGTLSSNGRLVLVNPAGIAVAPGAVIDTAGFTASTLGMSRADAIAGRLRFSSDGEGKAGRLQVQGSVLARQGDVVLIGTDVEAGSGGVLEARGGDLVLAAGRAVEVTGRGLEGIHLQVRAPQDRAVNLGTLRGDSVAIFAGSLRHSGLIEAASATVSGGRVLLLAADDADVRGRVTAATSERGGTVHITGDRVTLKGSAVVDASHANGGGEILVGGGSRGQDVRLPNARRVDVDADAVLKADATASGPGGTVIVWSDDRLDFAGTILARGAGGGARGRVEVDAAGSVRFRGKVDVASDGASPRRADDATGGQGPSQGGDKVQGKGAPQPLPYVPRQGQPLEVQAAMAASEGETVSYLARRDRRDAGRHREIADDGVRCVTR